MRKRRFAALLAFPAAAAVASARAEADAPLGRGDGGIDGLTLVPAEGVRAELGLVARAVGEGPVLRLSFAKTIDFRRFIAVESRPASVRAGARAVALRCRMRLRRGKTPRPAVLVFEKGGGAWFRTRSQLLIAGKAADKAGGKAADTVANELVDERVPLTSLREAGFSRDASGKLEWENVEKVWLGLVFDGPAEGTWEIASARFTSEPARPTRPLSVTGRGPGSWRVGHDPAVRQELTTPAEGPGGRQCMRFEFTFPGGRHMYAVPQTPAPDADLEGYRALRFTYRAELPPGVGGLLVMLVERGGAQYVAHPAPPASDAWRTVTIPFADFRLGSWTKDANGRLDLDGIASVAVACHGTSSGAGGKGVIRVLDVEFVP